jgi:hypothetical protein
LGIEGKGARLEITEGLGTQLELLTEGLELRARSGSEVAQ